MLLQCALTGFVVFGLFCSTVSSSEAKCWNHNYADLYHAAVEARVFEHWDKCVTSTHSAIKEYERARENTLECSKRCREPADFRVDSELALLQFYNALVKKSVCRAKCQREVPVVLETSESVRREFQDGVVYDNLVRCYAALGKQSKAASSAYTFLEYNPDNENMRNVLNTTVKSCAECSDVKPWKPKQHEELAVEAQKLYSRKEYAATSAVVEETIRSFLGSVEECQMLCETFPLPTMAARELSLSITKFITRVLECKTKCLDQLSYFSGSHHPRFLPELYHYLQYSYFESGLLEEACGATQSFLAFDPNDKDMLHNRGFYEDLPEVRKEWFIARKEAVMFLNQQEVQKKLLEKSRLKLKVQLSSARADLGNSDLGRGITVIHDDASLNGTSRFVAEGFSSIEECDTLVKMGHRSTIKGDGYNGRESPFSKAELFKGIDALTVGKLVRAGTIDPGPAELMMNLSERVRAYVESYFELSSELYFSYTHLVCRVALSDSTDADEGMSHPVHGDNCYLQRDGECKKQFPAYTWRDYSAVLYLNDDFEGGEFIFGKSRHDREATVQPKCGRAVGFSSDNLHGVLALRRGERCALAMWFTLDPSHKEQCRPYTARVIRERLSGAPTTSGHHAMGKVGGPVPPHETNLVTV